MSVLTTNAIFKLAQRISKLSSIEGFNPQEKELLEEVVTERAKKNAIQRRKELVKYLNYTIASEKHDETTQVEEIIENLSTDELATVLKKGKNPANGSLLLVEFTDILNTFDKSTTIRELLIKVF